MAKSVWNRLTRQAICLLLAGKMGIITEKVSAEENMAQKYTRNMIRNVFIEMLDERPFDEITVTDLVTRCEINRKTFYYYYQDLYAVLTEIFESELEAVLGGVKEHVTWEEGIAQAVQIALQHKRAVYHVYHSMQRETLEKQYMQAVARYRNKDEVRKMPELLAIASTVIGTGGLDFMGQVAGELGALDAGLGQFFTPYEVSRLMAEMNLGDATAAVAAKGFLTLCEPAAGAGGMMLAAADTLDRQGVDLCHVWM